MKWAEINVLTCHEAHEAVASILHEAGASGVEFEDKETEIRPGEIIWDGKPRERLIIEPSAAVTVKAYFPVNEKLEDIVSHIREQVAKLKDGPLKVGPAEVTFHVIASEDWETAWKKYYKPVRISEKIVIKPSWEEFEADDDTLVIELDPGMAFGTGTHPSTALALRALENTVNGDERVIDVGCGSGILSIAAIKLGAKHVLALDIDDIAVSATNKNVALNGISQHVDVKQNDLLNGITEQADIAIANILAEVIVTFVSDVAQLLTPGGTYITSGITTSKASLVIEALREERFELVETFDQDDWVAIVAKKR